MGLSKIVAKKLTPFADGSLVVTTLLRLFSLFIGFRECP
jgi:hypothetical protein